MKIHRIASKYSGPSWKNRNPPLKVSTEFPQRVQADYVAWKAKHFPNHSHSALLREMIDFYMTQLYPMEAHATSESDGVLDGGAEEVTAGSTPAGI